jgi:hypothetical protein
MLDQGAAGGGDLSGGQLDGGTMTPQEGDVDVQIEQVLVILVNSYRTIIYYFFQYFGSVSEWIRIQSGQWIRIQERNNDPQKLEIF